MFRNFITNKKFIAAWSVLYTLFLGVKCVYDFRIKMFAENGNFADFFINYSGGFVRRGLLGQLFLWCYQVSINPLLTAAIFASLVFLIIALYMISQFRKHNYNLCILTAGWFLGDFGLYGLTFMRRDYFIMCSFLLAAWLWKRMGIVKWLLFANVLVSITILCYEPFALFSIPFCVLLTRLKLRSWWKSLVCWLLPVISFFLCCNFAGGKDVYDAIVASTHEFVHVMLVSYILYTVSDEVMYQFGSRQVYLTTVFVLAGILRYMQITIVDVKSGSPTKVLIKDHFIQLCITGWVMSFLVLIYLK